MQILLYIIMNGMAEYMRKRRRARRTKLLELLGNKCQSCGSTENLEFDHKNPRRKQHDFNEIKDGPENAILKEIMKCSLLCANCHHDKTRDNNEYVNRDKKPARHGTIWKYKLGCRCSKCKKAISDYMKSKT